MSGPAASASRGPVARGATAELWRRLARPFDPADTAEALFGLPADVVTELAGVLLATCPEADALIETMPGALRSLKTSVGAHSQRCVGELRGPVLWSETTAARGSSMGSIDVFVCAAPHRAYDIDENQVLVAALRVVAEAIDGLGESVLRTAGDEGLERARENSRAARRFLEHGGLAQVRLDGKPSRRAVKRTRAGKSNHVYRPALSMLARAAEPLTLDEFLPYCDRRTRAQHAVVLALIEELEKRGLRIPALRAETGSLYAGPVEYRHPGLRGDRSRLHGILVGDLVVDVPERIRERNRLVAEEELQRRADGRPFMSVLHLDDVPSVVDRAIAAARGH